jgi:hypothetical protein
MRSTIAAAGVCTPASVSEPQQQQRSSTSSRQQQVLVGRWVALFQVPSFPS